MRGHIAKRGKDSYTIVLNLGRDPETGKRKQQWISVKGTKKDAEKRLADLLHQIDAGIFLRPSKITLAEFLDRWLKDYVHPNMSPRTAECYEHIVRTHLIPSLGQLPLSQLRPEHLQRYYTEKLSSGRKDGKGGLSARTVRYHHATLHDALKYAIKWDLLARNPADATDPPIAKRHEMKVMTEDEVQKFLEAAKSTQYYALFYIALFTGMRRSELLALRWVDVDLLLCQLSVTRALHQLRTREIVRQVSLDNREYLCYSVDIK